MEIIIILLIAVEVVIVCHLFPAISHFADYLQVLVRDVPEFFQEKEEEQLKRETLA